MTDLCAAFGLVLDSWQELILEHTLGERRDGKWAAKQVGISIPRQNGKSQMIVVRALAGALLFGEKTIIISAHQQDTARETFAKFTELIEENPALADRVESVMNALNREQINFKNGAKVKFKARSKSGGRGFSCDCLLLDEAQILGMPAWRSINSTMSARPNPQVWLLGTPPTPEDDGEVFSAIRELGHGGKSSTLAWLEWAADPGDDPALTETRRKANPAWDTRINHEVVQGEYETYPPSDFALERLGIWAPKDNFVGVFGPGRWSAIERTDAEVDTIMAFAISVSLDGNWASIAAAGQTEDGTWVVGAVDRREGTSWVIGEAVRLQGLYEVDFVMDEKCPEPSLAGSLETAGVQLVTFALTEVAEAHSQMRVGVKDRALVQPGHAELDGAVERAVWRMVGDIRVFGRKQSNGAIDMLEAAALAYKQALDSGSVYEERGLVTV